MIEREADTDDTPMPFGKYKGTPLGDVSPGYLIWLLAQPWAKKWGGVYGYIIQNESQIRAEADEEKQQGR